MKLQFAAFKTSISLVALLVPALSGGAQEFHLSLMSTGADELTGGFRDQQLFLSTNRPVEVRQLPAMVTAPLFATITLGPREHTGHYQVIVDEPANAPARLLVDALGDGNFSVSRNTTWIPEEAINAKDGLHYTNYSGTATVQVNYGTTTNSLSLTVYRFDKHDPRRAEIKDSMFYYADYIRTGQVTLNNHAYAAMLGDTLSTGDFRPATDPLHPSTTLYLDLNGDGKFSRQAEAFPAGKPFNIGGTTYELTNFSASGDSFQIFKSNQTVAETKPLANLSAGHPAPAFTAQTTTGEPLKFPNAYAGKFVLVDFWATWCGPCVREVPKLVDAYNNFHSHGLDVLGVSLDRTNAAPRLATFTRNHTMLWPQIYDGGYWKAEVARLYNIDSIPHPFLVDGDTGLIVAEGDSLRGEQLAATLAKFLGSKKQVTSAATPSNP